MEMKYVKFNKIDGVDDAIIVFPSTIGHNVIATLISTSSKHTTIYAKSAGFCDSREQVQWFCYGRSVLLGLSSDKDDSRLLNLKYCNYY